MALIDVAAESFDRMFFAIVFTRIIPTKCHLSSGGDAVTGESAQPAVAKTPLHGRNKPLSLKNFIDGAGTVGAPALS